MAWTLYEYPIDGNSLLAEILTANNDLPITKYDDYAENGGALETLDNDVFEDEFKKWTNFHIPMLKDIEWYYEYGDNCVYIFVSFFSPFTHESVNVDVAVWKYTEDE